MKLWTSNFAKASGNRRAVSIAVGAPKWFDGKQYSKLFPPWWLVKSKDEYSTEEWERHYYKDVLSKLDPVKVAAELGEGAVMLCWEKPEDFCHRHIVARWMTSAGVKVEELAGMPEKAAKEKIIIPADIPRPQPSRVQRFCRDGLNNIQNRALNLYEIWSTYPSCHNQARKIIAEIKEMTVRLKASELEKLTNISGYDFSK